MQTITSKLSENGIEIIHPVPPLANYVQTKTALGLIFISGQLPFSASKVLVTEKTIVYKGKIGKDLTLEEGKEAAKICMINILNQLSIAVEDDIAKVGGCLKLEIYINCESNFERHSEVANGASDLLIKILGERGKHSRIAIGVSSLPLNASVEIGAIFETTRE